MYLYLFLILFFVVQFKRLYIAIHTDFCLSVSYRVHVFFCGKQEERKDRERCYRDRAMCSLLYFIERPVESIVEAHLDTTLIDQSDTSRSLRFLSSSLSVIPTSI